MIKNNACAKHKKEAVMNARNLIKTGTYDDCYERDLFSWKALLSEDAVNNMLISMYPLYYGINGQIDYQRLRSDITEGSSQALSFFKALFSMPAKLKHNAMLPASLKLIEQKYGDKVFAHGVEEQKGGMCNLLLMLISNCVRVPTTYWGTFKKGMPNLSPFAHGPYYIIATTNFDRLNTKIEKNMPLNKIQYILVPFEENINILKATSNQLLMLSLIDENSHNNFCEKLVSYDNFLEQLQLTHGSKEDQANIDFSLELEKDSTVQENDDFLRSLLRSDASVADLTSQTSSPKSSNLSKRKRNSGKEFTGKLFDQNGAATESCPRTTPTINRARKTLFS